MKEHDMSKRNNKKRYAHKFKKEKMIVLGEKSEEAGVIVSHTHPNRSRRRRMKVLTRKMKVPYEYEGEKNVPFTAS